MVYGPITQKRPLPRQNADVVLLHAERFMRAQAAMSDWAEQAKKAVEYFENKQWKEEDLKLLEKQKRPALTINKIKPLVNLVLGYHINNRTQVHYLPGHDGSGSADMARVLTHVGKQIDEQSQIPYIDTEVYMDGILGGRGYYDARLDHSENDFGDVRWSALDPFSVYLDPDGEHYDLNRSNFVMTSRMISLDEIEFHYGKEAAVMVGPLVDGATYQAMPSAFYENADEITPFRKFGGDLGEDTIYSRWGQQFYDWVDRARKTIRMLDVQHYVWTQRLFFIDLETGDRKAIPDHWSRTKIERVLAWSQEQGQPLIVQKRAHRRVRWTQLIGDITVYDDWSPYESFTIVPFFPYFRRGKTKGMVEDLVGPQDEVNKRRSARLNYIGRMSNGGWQYAKGTLDAQQKANLEQFGSTPGVNIEWDPKGGQLPEPKQVLPPGDHTGQATLEHEAEDDLKQIAGINDAALGQLDRVQSGRAIEARQRQSIVGMEGFQLNYSRTKELCGRKQLELIQNHYTEQRVIRVLGGGASVEHMVINQRSAHGVINDVTLGKYSVMVDEAPLSKTFLEAQFEEMLRLKELQVPIPDDFIIDASSLGRKEELKAALAALRQQQAEMAAMGQDPAAAAGGGGEGPGPGGSRVGADGGSLPPGEPGAPIGPLGMPAAAE